MADDSHAERAGSASLFRRLRLPELRNRNRLDAERCQHLKSEGEGVPTAVDAVDERLGLHTNAVGHESLGELLVRHLFLLPEFFDERLCARLVQRSRAQGGLYIEIDLPASYSQTLLNLSNNSFLIYA